VTEHKEIDELTGAETTGHDWDGIKELTNPLPRWWVWTFYVTIAWAIAYWIAFPAWPLASDYTRGLLGYSQREVVRDAVAAGKAAQADNLTKIRDTELEAIRTDSELLEFALAGGRSAFLVNCSQCHGSGGAGGPGIANLDDDDWLWGGTLADIYETVRVGIRSDHDEARSNEMPAFLRDEILTPKEVDDIVAFVGRFAGASTDAAAAARGGVIFEEQCVACHGEGGVGNRELGAPNLTDAIWLYGSSLEDIRSVVANGRNGVMPAWEERLDLETRKLLAIYVHALGGGE
jgi:cytochrome c oxidase cbb3-type subunit 3